jgi:hypothetical protein
MMLVKAGGQHGSRRHGFDRVEPFPDRVFRVVRLSPFVGALRPFHEPVSFVELLDGGHQVARITPPDIVRDNPACLAPGAVVVRVIADPFPSHVLTLQI